MQHVEKSARGPTTVLTFVRVGEHPGFDRIVFQVGPVMSGYKIVRQSTSTFTEDASGRPITIKGHASLRVVLTTASDIGFSGSTDLKPMYPTIEEVREIGSFESVTSWGVGLSHAACFRVTMLTDPARLVVDVQH